jgi:hypothetical protein
MLKIMCKSTLNSDRSVSLANWAAAVYEELSRNGNKLPLTNLAVLYLNDLVIPCRVQRNICWL